MIPRKIHYCWFGRGEKPRLAQKCIASWKKYCPDYEIIEWNEDNFDVNRNAYTQMCYKEKKYAFLTDYLRLLIVEEHGGIYFDSNLERFDGVKYGYAAKGAASVDELYAKTRGEGFGAEPHNPAVRQMLAEYDPLLDGQHGTIGCPRLNTDALLKLGLELNGEKQKLSGAVVFPEDYLNPRSSVTGELRKTENTHSIHWYSASWMPWHKRLRSAISKPVHFILGRAKGRGR